MNEVKDNAVNFQFILIILILITAVAGVSPLFVEKALGQTFRLPWALSLFFTLILLAVLSFVIVQYSGIRNLILTFCLLIGFEIFFSLITTISFRIGISDFKRNLAQAFLSATFTSSMSVFIHIVGSFFATLCVKGLVISKEVEAETLVSTFVHPSVAEPAEATAPSAEAEVPEEKAGTEPEAPSEVPTAAQVAKAAGEVVLRLGDIVPLLREEDVAVSLEEIKEGRFGNVEIVVPFSEILPQLPEGVVEIDVKGILSQIPSEAFQKSIDEIASEFPNGKLELPLDKIVLQLPEDIFSITYSEKEKESIGDEFPELFVEARLKEIMEKTPEVPVAKSVAEEVEEERPAPEPISEAAEVEQREEEEVVFDESEEAVKVNVGHVVAQFPEDALAIAIDDLEKSLPTEGKIFIPTKYVIPQLAEGKVEIKLKNILPQFPENCFSISVEDLVSSIPEGRVELPLHEIVSQLPAEVFNAPEGQREEEEAVEGLPELFKEEFRKEIGVEVPEEAAPVAEEAGAIEEEIVGVEEMKPEPAEVEAGEFEIPEKEYVEISWERVLNLFPAGTFNVTKERLVQNLADSRVRIGQNIVMSQLSEGAITVPVGYVITQFPAAFLELSKEEVEKRFPDGRIELPLDEIVTALPESLLALPEGQMEEVVDEKIPALFAEVAEVSGGIQEKAPEAEALLEQEEEPVVAAAPAEGAAMSDKDIEKIEELLARKREAEEAEKEEVVEELFAPAEGVSAEVRKDEVGVTPAGKVEAEREKAPIIHGVEEKRDEIETKALSGDMKKEFERRFNRYRKFNVSKAEILKYKKLGFVIFSSHGIDHHKFLTQLTPTTASFCRFCKRFHLGEMQKLLFISPDGVVVIQCVDHIGKGNFFAVAAAVSGAPGLVGLFADADAGYVKDLLNKMHIEKKGFRMEDYLPVEEWKEYKMDGGEKEAYVKILGILGKYGIEKWKLIKFSSGKETSIFYPRSFPEEEMDGYDFSSVRFLAIPSRQLGFGAFEKFIGITDSNFILINKINISDDTLLCIFPNEYKLGLIKLQTEKAVRLLQ